MAGLRFNDEFVSDIFAAAVVKSTTVNTIIKEKKTLKGEYTGIKVHMLFEADFREVPILEDAAAPAEGQAPVLEDAAAPAEGQAPVLEDAAAPAEGQTPVLKDAVAPAKGQAPALAGAVNTVRGVCTQRAGQDHHAEIVMIDMLKEYLRKHPGKTIQQLTVYGTLSPCSKLHESFENSCQTRMNTFGWERNITIKNYYAIVYYKEPRDRDNLKMMARTPPPDMYQVDRPGANIELEKTENNIGIMFNVADPAALPVAPADALAEAVQQQVNLDE